MHIMKEEDYAKWKAKLASAIASRNYKAIGNALDHGRMRRMTYADVASVACELGKFDAREWESILEEVDNAESNDESNE